MGWCLHKGWCLLMGYMQGWMREWRRKERKHEICSMPALNQSGPKVPWIYTAASSFVFLFFPSPLPHPFLYVDTTPYVDTPRM